MADPRSRRIPVPVLLFALIPGLESSTFARYEISPIPTLSLPLKGGDVGLLYLEGEETLGLLSFAGDVGRPAVRSSSCFWPPSLDGRGWGRVNITN
jgi:hypothetical protein